MNPLTSESLAEWGLTDHERARANLAALKASVPAESFAELSSLLAKLLPRVAAPDMALNNLERFLAQPSARSQLPSLLDSRARGLETLLQLLSTSQFFADTLVTNPEFLDMVRIDLRRHPSTFEMQQQLQSEVDEAYDDAAILRAFRKYRQRHQLRIGANDIIRDRPLEEITRDLSRVADVVLEVALETAIRQLSAKFGSPFTDEGASSRGVMLAFGKHGGEELNYSSDIDLMFVYDDEGSTRGKRTSITNEEFFSRVVSEVVRLLSAHTDRGQAYRTDFRLRPEGQRGSLARSLPSTLVYYDRLGRTWERQALIKVRPVAGDLKLGAEFLRLIEPFVYRKYLSFAEINEIKAMKRRIEQKAHQAGISERDVKTGRGGIRDIEFTIQFLQLLNGGDLPEVRQRSTLSALEALESAGCLTDQEFRALEDGYRFLRKTEHRLQLLFDWQTHQLPEPLDELRRLARRMGYTSAKNQKSTPEPVPSDLPGAPQKRSPIDEPVLQPRLETRDLLFDPLDQFLHDLHDKTDRNRKILDFLLHQTFADDRSGSEPESDLILVPDPDESTIRAVLGRYPFRDVLGAYQNLIQLAQESVVFLSTRRCRHFFSSIAPSLLKAVAETPDPDLALVNLEKVTASLGAKTVLWELFSFNPPSLKLYVDLCAGSPFLSEILINNPGMIDELLDSLVLNQPRDAEELRTELTELCRGASDLEPILHSFQDKELLRIGVRDILAKDSVRNTSASLSDLAEVILERVIAWQEPTPVQRYGRPLIAEGPRAGEVCRYAILALGKLGGREMSYHSDLDLILIYEGDGKTEPIAFSDRFERMESIENFQYFTELAQRIIKATSHLGPMGRLYAVDMRLRPAGNTGGLVLSLNEFRRYHEAGGGELWERQTLTRARPVHGDPEFAQELIHAVREVIFGREWTPQCIDEMVSMRERLEHASNPRSLKRGPGGMMDVEFIVQMFLMKYRCRDLHRTNIWDALDALLAGGLLGVEEHQGLKDAYSFMRQVESRLRIVTNRALNETPKATEDLEKLARRLGFENSEQFRNVLQDHMKRVRKLFGELMRRER